MTAPTASYRPKDPGSAAFADRDLYRKIVTAPREKRDEFIIAPRSGRAWPVRAGQIFRVTTIEGPQVGDLNLWHRHDPRERLWSSRTRQLQAAHVTTFDRLWSTLPSLRPMATIIADTVPRPDPAQGGRVHDLLGTRCDPYVTKLLAGVDYDLHCQSNLARAIAEYGLTEADVHDPLNMFQVTGLTTDDEYYFTASPARSGDYLEFFAEIDLLVGVGNCPGGDLSLPMWGPDGRSDVPCRPLGIDIWEPDRDAFASWREPRPVAYEHKGTVPA
jgi:uncharacterized protein YcgI (DUF1989 family)